MSALGDALHALVQPTLRGDDDLRRFVRRVTAGCVATALSLDFLANLALGTEAWAMLRSSFITGLISTFVAWPVIVTVARAHLDLYRTKAELEELARRDPLTGLANRREMMACADAMDAARLLMAIVDIDRFKAINDAHGHLAGDAVIAAAGQRLQEALGDLGTVCRVGGEEFAMLADGIDPGLLRHRLVDVVRRIADEPVAHGGRTIPVTVSVGVSSGRRGATFEEIYSAADRALYVAKASGRNRICYDGELETRLDPPLPPDEITWVDPAEAAARSDRADAA